MERICKTATTFHIRVDQVEALDNVWKIAKIPKAAMVRDAIDLYLSIYEIMDQIKQAAKEADISPGELVRRAIEERLERSKTSHAPRYWEEWHALFEEESDKNARRGGKGI